MSAILERWLIWVINPDALKGAAGEDYVVWQVARVTSMSGIKPHASSGFIYFAMSPNKIVIDSVTITPSPAGTSLRQACVIFGIISSSSQSHFYVYFPILRVAVFFYVQFPSESVWGVCTASILD